MDEPTLFNGTGKPAVLVTRCLLGTPCRYHGHSTAYGKPIGRRQLIERLRKRYRLIDVCPEVDAGLPVPRPPTRIVKGRWLCDGKDVTAAFKRGAQLTLARAREDGCKRAYLLRGSPACDKTFGMCGTLLVLHGIKVVSV